MAACDAYGEAERRYGVGSEAAEEEFERGGVACDVVNEIDWRLANTPPTTLAGVAALLRFANEIEDAGLEWPNTDAIGPDGWHYQLRATMTAAIEALIKVPAGKAGALMKRRRKPAPELSPAIAALRRLSDAESTNDAAIRRRIGLIAAERKLDPSETKAIMTGRLSTYQIGQFCEKHHLSHD
jgi:hypothetical protein